MNTHHRRGPHAAVSSSRSLPILLGALAMFGAFSIDTIFPAFPQIAAEFGAGKVGMQQTISAYLATYAAMSLVHGPFSDALGRKRVIIAGLVLYALASLGCALSTSLPMLITFRMLQGMCAGVGLIVGRAVIRDVFADSQAQKVMAQVSMIFGIAPAVAPIVGGWILGWSHWQMIFGLLVLLGLSLSLATLAWLPETHPANARTPLRLKPLLQGYVEIAKHGRFRRLSLVAAFNFGALFLYIASAPDIVLTHLHRGPDEFYLLFVPVISSMVLGAFVSGRMAGKVPGKTQLQIGFGATLVAAVTNVAYTQLAEQLGLPWMILPVMLIAFGIALVSPIITLANLDLFPHRRGGASSVQAFVQLVFNALVAGLMSPWLSHGLDTLALGAAACSVLGWLIWLLDRWLARTRLPDATADCAALEPFEDL